MIAGWFSVSKKSAPCRWAWKFSSLTWIEAGSTEPVSFGVSPVVSSVASTLEKSALNDETMYLIAKPAVEWTGSMPQVAAGRAVVVAVLMVEVLPVVSVPDSGLESAYLS